MTPPKEVEAVYNLKTIVFMGGSMMLLATMKVDGLDKFNLNSIYKQSLMHKHVNVIVDCETSLKKIDCNGNAALAILPRTGYGGWQRWGVLSFLDFTDFGMCIEWIKQKPDTEMIVKRCIGVGVDICDQLSPCLIGAKFSSCS